MELVPGVKRAFENFHADAADVVHDPNGHIVVDDGRRFLARTNEKFDVIIIDPPPPEQQPASSLLYSTEFYELIKQRLAPDGVLQQWWGFPWAGSVSTPSATLSLARSFPFIRAFGAVDDPLHAMFGYHFLCSFRPLETLSADNVAARMPPAARRDLEEWLKGPDRDREMLALIGQMVSREFALAEVVPPSHRLLLTDDRPVNEYYFLREHGWFDPTAP